MQMRVLKFVAVLGSPMKPKNSVFPKVLSGADIPLDSRWSKENRYFRDSSR